MSRTMLQSAQEVRDVNPSPFWQYMSIFIKTYYATPPSVPHGFRSPLPRPSPTQRSARHPVPFKHIQALSNVVSRRKA